MFLSTFALKLRPSFFKQEFSNALPNGKSVCKQREVHRVNTLFPLRVSSLLLRTVWEEDAIATYNMQLALEVPWKSSHVMYTLASLRPLFHW